MTETHKRNLLNYKIKTIRDIKDPEFCVFEEYRRLDNYYISACMLSDFDLMDYYGACLDFFVDIVNKNLSNTFAFSLN